MSLRESFPQVRTQDAFDKLIDPIISNVEDNGGSSHIILRIHENINLVEICLVPEIDAYGEPINWNACVVVKPISLIEAITIEK